VQTTPVPQFAAAPVCRRFLAVWAGLLLGAFAACAVAQDFPVRPIRMVMGGGADQLARIVADAMAARYGQAVYVEQKAGAAGAMATDFMSKAPPDGYTWMMTTVSYTGQRILQKRPPGQGELEPVTMLATFPFILVVNNDLPAHTLPELVALARAQPGKLNFASSGNGAPGHLAGEMLKQMAGIDMLHVPYKSVAQGLTDVIANQVQVMFVPAPAVLPQIRAGRVRALAVSTGQRFKALPDMPTVAEQGWPDYLYVSWNGIHAPPGTPPALLDRIAADITATINTPAMRARAEAAGLETVAMGRQEFGAYMQADLARIAKVVRDGNIKPD
jgi:tripartite-type tricarboxylate transporter receptor subunit TctC